MNNFNSSYVLEEQTFEANVKIRYNMNSVKAKITLYNNEVNIEFSEPVSGIAPGQACVLYDTRDGHLIGGGFI